MGRILNCTFNGALYKRRVLRHNIVIFHLFACSFDTNDIDEKTPIRANEHQQQQEEEEEDSAALLLSDQLMDDEDDDIYDMEGADEEDEEDYNDNNQEMGNYGMDQEDQDSSFYLDGDEEDSKYNSTDSGLVEENPFEPVYPAAGALFGQENCNDSAENCAATTEKGMVLEAVSLDNILPAGSRRRRGD